MRAQLQCDVSVLRYNVNPEINIQEMASAQEYKPMKPFDVWVVGANHFLK